VDFYVERDGELVAEPITVAPTHFRRLGLRMDISKITAVADRSPAFQAGFKVGDKITHIDGKPVGTGMDPLDLPDYFYSRRPGGELEEVEVNGQLEKDVIVTVARRQEEGEDQVIPLRVTPGDRPGWTYLAFGEDIPLDVPSIGLAYHMIPSFILSVEPDSPAAEAGIKKGERLSKIEFLSPGDGISDILGKEKLEIKFGEKAAEGKQNWAFAFRVLQMAPARTVKLTVLNEKDEPREVELTPEPVDNWFLPDNRGIRLEDMWETQSAKTFLAAISMGITHTKNSASDIYLTLRNLFGGSISYKELHGPVGIAKVAYHIASNGLPELLLFLGFLSVNLAVLNFLPIPVLDGGHMVFLIWEGVTRSKPSERVLWAAQALGFLFVVGLMLLVLFLDIFVHGHVN
jgi:regulator of sigma E protease